MSSNLENTNKNDKDLSIAQWLCKELKSDNKDSIVEIYKDYSRGFLMRIRSRLYESRHYKPEDVLQEFWEILLKGDVFCRYTSGSGSSLVNYLNAVLYRHIINKNREIIKERNQEEPGVVNEVLKTIEYPKSPEEITIASEEERKRAENKLLKQEIVYEACLQLSEFSPKDAAYVKMRYFECLEYRDIALRELGKVVDEEAVKKKVAAIRKQFTRPRTGSEARFKVLLERIMEIKNITLNDILDEL